MIDSQILAFLGLVLMLTITPGADTMLVMRNAIAYGRQSGLLTVVGGCGGIMIHATLSAMGLSVILVRYAAVYEIVKLIGASYLIWLGLQSLWRALYYRSSQHAYTTHQQIGGKPGWNSLNDGLLTNVFNPKTALFYLALLPQFVDSSDRVLVTSLLLAGIHVVMRFAWLSLVTILLQYIRALIAHPLAQRSLEAATGVILFVFGLRLALVRRE